MKSFKQHISEGYDFSKHLKKSDSKEVPYINHHGEVGDFPEEAKRQFDNFRETDHSYPGDNEEAPKAIPGNFYDKHNIKRHWSVKEIEKNPDLAARHLDHLHHHFPEIAKHYNMKPMTPESSEEETGYESPHK